jgi:hypothetical protein
MVVGLAGGCCFDFDKSNEHEFVVGTEEGSIDMYSREHNTMHVRKFGGETAHHMAVYAVKWNHFNPNGKDLLRCYVVLYNALLSVLCSLLSYSSYLLPSNSINLSDPTNPSSVPVLLCGIVPLTLLPLIPLLPLSTALILNTVTSVPVLLGGLDCEVVGEEHF